METITEGVDFAELRWKLNKSIAEFNNEIENYNVKLSSASLKRAKGQALEMVRNVKELKALIEKERKKRIDARRV